MKRLLFIFLLPLVALSQPFTASDIAFLSKPMLVTDWATRVVANGGAMPSQNTIVAMENLRLGCIAAGLTNKIYSLCVFVPDSLIACCTPLFYHLGYTNWGNSNFVSGDLNINGLKGGTTKALVTGVRSEDAFNSTSPPRGMTVIVTESASNEVSTVMGQIDAGASDQISLVVSSGGDTEWRAGSANSVYVTKTVDWGRVGYVSANVTTNVTTNITVYVASPLESHKVLTNREMAGNLSFPMPEEGDSISVFSNQRDGTNDSFANVRMSLAMITKGFTEAESSNFWVLAKTCREAIGGGTGDNIHDYNRKIVNAGGDNISTTSSNALRTFYAGLDTDGVLYSLLAVNPYLPDSLVAVRTPVIWQTGSQYWTNFNFGSTNLTVNGLTGNLTTKSLGTGINLSTTIHRGFTDTSGGISLLIHTAPTSTGSLIEYGSAGISGNTLFALQHFGATMSFYCWRFTTINTDFVTVSLPAPGTNWVGYVSGNRTAANAIRLEYATNTVYVTATNATGSTPSNNNLLTNSFAHALYSSGVPVGNWSDRTISYLSVSSGLTVTQSSNQWNRVKDLRTALGGGYP